MRRALLSIILIAAVIPAWAQEPAEPDEPAIILPPMFLEVEDLQVEEVDAALPEDEAQLRPEVSIPLPEADALYLPEEAFDIPYPDQISAPETSGSPESVTYIERIERIEREQPSTIFSDGRIGVGYPYHVLGDLTLYKLGDEPRFRIRFLHDKIDGIKFESIGSGFYYGVDILDGSFSYDTGTMRFQAEGSIGESARGLQDVITYGSVAKQEIGGRFDFSYLPLDTLTLTGGLHTRYANQILSSADPTISYEFQLNPRIEVIAALDGFELGGSLDYLFLSYADPDATVSDRSILGASVVGSYFFPIDLDLSFEAGILVPFGQTPQVLPDVSVTINGGIGTLLRFQSSAGYTSMQPAYADLWDSSPLLALGSNITPASTLSWSGNVQVRPVSELYLTAGVGIGRETDAINPEANADATTGLFGFRQQPMTTLSTEITAQWDISRAITLSGTWNGVFIERERFEPVQEFGLNLDLKNPSETFGGYLGAELSLWPDPTVPVVDLGGFYRVSDSVMFELDAADVLSPVLDSGRQGWGEYVQTGFNILLTTKISL